MPAMPRILGLHHVTAIASDAQKNVDFYAGVLGLKLVKVSVNGDDPTSLHLYYGDEHASPGSLVTFFVYPGIERGRAGWPQVPAVSYVLPYRSDRPHADLLTVNGFAVPEPYPNHRHSEVDVTDPDGLRVRLMVEFLRHTPRRGKQAVTTTLQRPHFFDHTFWSSDATATQEFLSQRLGLEPDLQINPGGGYFGVGNGAGLSIAEGGKEGRPGAGTVHHIAFRIATDEEQVELHAKLTEAGVDVSPIIDRFYFKSICFREPGGILLEVATDGPGFAVDEPPDRLGRKLCLPPWLEPRRAEIERAVPRFTLPTGETIGGN